VVGRRLEIGAAVEILLEDALHLGERLDGVQPAAQVGRAGQSLHVPPEMLPELDRGAARVRLVISRHAGVLECHAEAPFDRWRRRHGPALEQRTGLREDPRLAKGAARDHDARAPRLALHAQRVLWRLDVAVAEHRDVERGDDGGDLVPASTTGVHLGARPRMQREHARAGVLAAERDPDGVARLLAPTAADLYRHRQVGVARHRGRRSGASR
jgi:hypothetical protein